ncbi:hypothetical protein GT034_15665 [Streptomyces sp. SID2563]|uniref:hypothetical protein n=1 Tax=Streptomyces sp. SID2563 TaxID=2690255 RepID=UPI00137059EE|nr:hypothetical protein [Streptomyces sp. SID2563]MYW09785.1 hypothetical protein [Streptomyces sp. SID2563]
MPEPLRSPMPESHPLPPFHGLMAVDVKDSTRLPSREHAQLSRTLTEIVHQGLELAGLKEMPREFENHSGDGLAFGFDPSWVPHVISPFADVLNTLLQEHNAGPGPHLRLRMSLHIGPVPRSPGLPGDGNAAPRSETHRLLDSVPAREWLARADADATPLVLIVSDTVYRRVVVDGYCALPAARFAEVHAEVAGKDFAQTAWIYVPSPSGDLLTGSDAADVPDHEEAVGKTAEPAPAAPRQGGTRLQFVESGVAVMDSTMGDFHHHTESRHSPDRNS